MQQQTFQLYVAPIAATPAQTLRVSLGGQNCRIDLFQKGENVFMNLFLNDAPIVLGRLCVDRVTLTPEQYTGFGGDLFFKDTLGASDPDYTGFGGRFILCYQQPVAAS
ncbi:MAG: hypothetical protein LBH10_06385 [Burkholderiaceae bacterium]|jgi:hypothetical protein|nr:hypothetical protein [Burkholderiaceae bacterium]